MLRRFEWIRDGGYFADFRWDSSLPDFKRINVIYGNNGSGKSSIACMLDGCGSTPDGHKKASIVLEDNDHLRVTNGQSDPVYGRVLVFGEDYIARSHRFRDGSVDMDAVLTLGQRTAEDEERLAGLRAEQQSLIEERKGLDGEKHEKERELERAYGRVAEAVVGDTSRAGGMYASRGKYSVARVKTRLDELRGELAALPPGELAAKRRLISSENRESLNTGNLSLAIRPGLVDTARRLLAATPVTIVLDTLKAHPEASAWVQEGVQLHRESAICAFCGGPVSDDRKGQIEQHFSDHVARLQRELGDLDGEVRGARADGGAIAREVPASGLLFDDLRSGFEREVQAVLAQVGALEKWCDELSSKLTAKRANVLGTVDYDPAAPPAINGAELVKICHEHDQRVGAHAQLVQDAARAVELHHLKSEEGRVDALVAWLHAAGSRLIAIETRLAILEAEISGLESAEGDPVPSAQVLTREVARLLGRQELRFEASGKRYRVLREGSPASGLSVGERTAITLVHFLETVARFDPASGKPIVVIDDPVSSLDSNVFMGISTYIWSAVVTLSQDRIGQLFLLTHNFELFRQWDIQLESLHKDREMRALFPAELYELRSRHLVSTGVARRGPFLAKWPESPAVRKKMRSSYHHAFMLMANAHEKLKRDDTIEHRMDAQLLFPNLIRRVLESFLAFKRPGHAGDFTGAMRETTAMLESAGYQGNAEALRQQLTRYTHAYSHSESPDTNDVVNPEEVAGALSATFSFMRHLDGEHFRGLCGVVGVDPDVLVPPPIQEGDGIAS